MDILGFKGKATILRNTVLKGLDRSDRYEISDFDSP